MPPRPSEPVLRLIRDSAKAKGMNTAALARKAGLERSRLKHVLAGSEPLTVDELIVLSEALELGPTELAGIPDQPETEEPPKPSPVQGLQAIVPDPYGNHAEQALRLGYALGCDLFLVLDTKKVADIGLPAHIKSQFPERLPIRLDAAFHVAQDARFLPEGLRVNLSFDSLYTVVIPWDGFAQVALVPLPPEPVAEPPEPSGQGGKQRGHLRLIE